jgi:hypothetical protein
MPRTEATVEMQMGDLVRTTTDLVIRKDGLLFDETDCDPPGKIPRDWLDAADTLPAGTLCTFIRLGEEDPAYAIINRSLLGRFMTVKLSRIELVTSMAVAADDVDGADDDCGTLETP